MNVAAGRAHNGDLIVISSGWSNRYPPGRKGAPFRAGILDPWVCLSADGGRTFNIDRHGFPAKGPRGGRCVPFGEIPPGHDRVLRVAIYEVLDLRDDRDLPPGNLAAHTLAGSLTARPGVFTMNRPWPVPRRHVFSAGDGALRSFGPLGCA